MASESNRETSVLKAAAALSIFGRDAELSELRFRISQRHSFLFYGPAGVGKSLLLLLTWGKCPRTLYSPASGSPQELYKNLATSLLTVRNQALTRACARGVASLEKKSAVAMRGIVREALNGSEYLVILDHMKRPSQAVAAAVRELMSNCSVPVVAVSRSAHMEDAGFVLPLYPGRSDRISLRNFDSDVALHFARWCAEAAGLKAMNLDAFLSGVVQQSEGNPGAIKRMIQMAKLPKYSSGGQIKSAPLCIDFKISAISR